MKSKKHILLLTPGFPVDESDNTCIPALQAIVRELKQQLGEQHVLSVITFQYPFEPGDYSWNTIPVWSAGGKNKSLPLKFFTWYRVWKKFKQLHSENPIDVIHSFWLHECTFLGKRIANHTGAKHVAMVMGQDVLPGNGYMKFMSMAGTFIIANSPFSAQLLEKNYRIKADAVIPIGISSEDFEGIDFHAERSLDLLNVGSLIPLKNQMLFIELFSELKKQFPALTGAIVGSGILEKELSEKISSMKLTDNLKLYPGLPRKEVLEMMSHSKILVHTSDYESAGYVLLEGLYSGMKVVNFPTGYLPQSENAYTCNTADEMKNRIAVLLKDPQNFSRMDVPEIRNTAEKIIESYRL